MTPLSINCAADGGDTSEAESTTAALALVRMVVNAPSLAVAAQQVVQELARVYATEHCTLALWTRGELRILATSAGCAAAVGAPADPDDERRLGAMHESLAQGVAQAYPPLPGSEGQIGHELRLLQRVLRGVVATVPIGSDGCPLAVVCLERRSADKPFDVPTLDSIETALTLVAPALQWLARSEQGIGRHFVDVAIDSWNTLRRPDHRARRRLVFCAAILIAGLCILPVDREVGGRARLEGRQELLVSAPIDGFVKTAWVRPGDHVKAGQPLLDLVDGDLRLERERLASQLAQRENGYAEAMARADRVGASSSMAEVAETQAQLGMVDAEIARSRLVAPFDGLVVQGDLAQATGAAVKQGDPLVTLAADDAGERVVIEVDEADIGLLRPGQNGRASVSSLPWESFGVTVERVTPLARAVEGRNIFAVDARLDSATPALRPGLLGRAQIVVGRAPLAWTWAGHLRDAVRAVWWSWLA